MLLKYCLLSGDKSQRTSFQLFIGTCLLQENNIKNLIMCIYFLLFFSDGFIHIVMFYAKCPLYCMSSNYLHPCSDFSLRLKNLSSFPLSFFLDCLLPRKITFMGFFLKLSYNGLQFLIYLCKWMYNPNTINSC